MNKSIAAAFSCLLISTAATAGDTRKGEPVTEGQTMQKDVMKQEEMKRASDQDDMRAKAKDMKKDTGTPMPAGMRKDAMKQPATASN
jgi:pentapeptide MXKDX repeat protein